MLGDPLETPQTVVATGASEDEEPSVAKRPAATQGMMNASEDLLGDSLETPQTVVGAGA